MSVVMLASQQMCKSALRHRGTLRAAIAAVTVSVGSGLVGCRDLAGTQALPVGTPDPSFYDNATGALGMRNAAFYSFGNVLPEYISRTGLLTDELTDMSAATSSPGTAVSTGGQVTVTNPLDERMMPELSYGASGTYKSDGVYTQLQTARGLLLQAMGQLATYDASTKDTAILRPSVDSVLRGELYALYGYTEVMLADFFCSGIPLSTLDFHKDFTYRAGSTTEQVYRDAIAKFDTALALSVDSARIHNLARVGLGRAYLDLAYRNPAYVAAAADDVSKVPNDYQYQMSPSWLGTVSAGNGGAGITDFGIGSETEGMNGLPYMSSGDPRTADTTLYVLTYNNTIVDSVPVGFPKVYSAALTGNYSPMTIASGVEARLIQAEAALQSGGAGVVAWLQTLNTLRATALFPGTTQTTGLPALLDPGTDSARLAVTFSERASWLYLTGHRQGDLRRQLRQYGRYWSDQSHVYPSGMYRGAGVGTYGRDVTAPIPSNEYINPLFQGCKDRAP